MRLRDLQITNYRSVEDSTRFKIEDLTALVGKNESGKTSILQALYKLNPVDEKERYDVDREYPRRHLNEYKGSTPPEPARVVSSIWELEAKDLTILHGLVGSNAVKSNFFEVKKGFDDQKGEQRQTWGLQVDEQEALTFVFGQAALTEQDHAGLTAVGPAPTSVKELSERLTKVAAPTDNLKKLSAHLTAKFRGESARRACYHAVNMPEFVYFGNYDRLPGRINIDQLASKVANPKQLTRGDEIALAFLNLAQLKIEEVQQAKTTESLIAKLEGVSNRITKMIFKYWSQNRHLRIQVRVDTPLPEDPLEFRNGKVLSIRIENTHHEVTVPFDERSAGFVWFFSFLVYFWQIEKKHGDNLFILLDEPGLSLHARAQADLLRYFKNELLPKKQVMFSTHSPFMIPPDNILCARTVEDVVIEIKDAQGQIEETKVLGTKVSGDVMSIDRDTLFPLQGAPWVRPHSDTLRRQEYAARRRTCGPCISHCLLEPAEAEIEAMPGPPLDHHSSSRSQPHRNLRGPARSEQAQCHRAHRYEFQAAARERRAFEKVPGHPEERRGDDRRDLHRYIGSRHRGPTRRGPLLPPHQCGLWLEGCAEGVPAGKGADPSPRRGAHADDAVDNPGVRPLPPVGILGA